MSTDAFDGFLNVLCDRRPFQMFTVNLKNGERFQIDHPRAVAFNSGRGVFLGPGGVFVMFDHDSVSHFTDESAQTLA